MRASRQQRIGRCRLPIRRLSALHPSRQALAVVLRPEEVEDANENRSTSLNRLSTSAALALATRHLCCCPRSHSALNLGTGSSRSTQLSDTRYRGSTSLSRVGRGPYNARQARSSRRSLRRFWAPRATEMATRLRPSDAHEPPAADRVSAGRSPIRPMPAGARIRPRKASAAPRDQPGSAFAGGGQCLLK
jgi:hypothetical protein